MIKSRHWTPEPIVVFSESAYGDGDGEEWSEKKFFGAECFFPEKLFQKLAAHKKQRMPMNGEEWQRKT